MTFNAWSLYRSRDLICSHRCERERWGRESYFNCFLNIFVPNNRLHSCVGVMNEQLIYRFEWHFSLGLTIFCHGRIHRLGSLLLNKLGAWCLLYGCSLLCWLSCLLLFYYKIFLSCVLRLYLWFYSCKNLEFGTTWSLLLLSLFFWIFLFLQYLHFFRDLHFLGYAWHCSSQIRIIYEIDSFRGPQTISIMLRQFTRNYSRLNFIIVVLLVWKVYLHILADQVDIHVFLQSIFLLLVIHVFLKKISFDGLTYSDWIDFSWYSVVDVRYKVSVSFLLQIKVIDINTMWSQVVVKLWLFG